jgi:hypothetical protein
MKKYPVIDEPSDEQFKELQDEQYEPWDDIKWNLKAIIIGLWNMVCDNIQRSLTLCVVLAVLVTWFFLYLQVIIWR